MGISREDHHPGETSQMGDRCDSRLWNRTEWIVSLCWNWGILEGVVRFIYLCHKNIIWEKQFESVFFCICYDLDIGYYVFFFPYFFV